MWNTLLYMYIKQGHSYRYLSTDLSRETDAIQDRRIDSYTSMCYKPINEDSWTPAPHQGIPRPDPDLPILPKLLTLAPDSWHLTPDLWLLFWFVRHLLTHPKFKNKRLFKRHFTEPRALKKGKCLYSWYQKVVSQPKHHFVPFWMTMAQFHKFLICFSWTFEAQPRPACPILSCPPLTTLACRPA